jgi:serine/threonine protein kinase
MKSTKPSDDPTRTESPPLVSDTTRTATFADSNSPTTSATPDDDRRAASQSLPSRIVIPGYEIIKELGRGGMGVVYKARQIRLNRLVALKVLLADGHADSKTLIRFLAEAESVAAIKHPNVLQVYEFGDTDGRPYLALEYLHGGTLAERFKSSRQFDPKSAATLISKIALGVHAAHEKGIVHRDLKPGNVLFDESGEPKVADFGLAKRSSGADLTRTQAVMGTPAYMAPEQARGEAKFVGPPADIYALGVMLYESLTGSRPFEGDTAFDLLRKVVEDNPTLPRRKVPGLPRDIELICLKCLAKQKNDRYSSAALLADDLAKFTAGERISIRSAGSREKLIRIGKQIPKIVTASAMGLLAVCFSVAVASRFVSFDNNSSNNKTKDDGNATSSDQTNPTAIERHIPEDGKPSMPTSPDKQLTARRIPANTSFDVGGCVMCHYGSDQPGARRFNNNYKSNEYIRHNEYVVWDKQDPHSLAFRVIVPEKNPLAQRMQSLLAKTKPTGYRVDSDVACLKCHSTDLNPGSASVRKLEEFVRQEDLGIVCAACHGLDARWQTAHFTEPPAPGTLYPTFRTRTPEQKWTDYGLIDLRNSIRKAELCASCHIGNPDEGKVITHEMFGAGHPPIPPFEMSAYIHTEPRHWASPTELPFLINLAQADPTKALKLFHARSESQETCETRTMAIGSIVSLRMEMNKIIQRPTDVPFNPGMIIAARIVSDHAAEYLKKKGRVLWHAAKFSANCEDMYEAGLQRHRNEALLNGKAQEIRRDCDIILKEMESEIVYSIEETRRLADLLARTVVDPATLRDPETVAHVTWAYATLDFALKKDAPRRDAILALSPIRLPDRSKPGERPVTVGAVLEERMKQLREFDPKKFVAKFGEVK